TAGFGLVEVQVGNDQFGLDALHGFEPGRGVVERMHLVAFGTEKFRDHLQHRDFVVYQENSGHVRESKRFGLGEQVVWTCALNGKAVRTPGWAGDTRAPDRLRARPFDAACDALGERASIISPED